MKYNNLIGVSEGFQASVNLEYDLGKPEKIEGYIPTGQSVKLLGEFLKAYYYNNEPQSRATVLIGPYGRGKSHLLLILSALLSLDVMAQDKSSEKAAREIQQKLCEKIARVDENVGALARAIVDSGIRTLPVIVNSNSTDINQSFLIAMSDSLRNAGLGELLPETYFDAAISVIDRWRSDFPDAFDRFREELSRHKLTENELYISLRRFDRRAYELFCECYPKIAAGSKFNPLTNMDVVKLYLSVTDKLRENTKYHGITVIFDEFSKFLEANLDKSRMLSFKIIQDMAEAATRSSSAQLHFICVTHKDILEYSSSDSFRTVEGRFRKLNFVASSEQSYELIANAITKKKSFADFCESHSDDFKNVASECAMTNVFEELDEASYLQKLVYGCFPLTPLAAYALLHISELVGQNERTLFTFLSDDGPHTLRAFLKKDHKGFETITLDSIYGYFEDQFRKEIFNASVHTMWSKADSAQRQVSDADQKKIIETIAILNMIGDERLKAIPINIKASLMMSDDRFDYAIRGLLKRHIISQRDSSEYILLTANGVDVQKRVDSYVKTKPMRINVGELLERAVKPGYLIPHAYNDRFAMTRFFAEIFMDAAEFMNYKSAAQLLSGYPADGLIIDIVCADEELSKDVLGKISGFGDSPQLVVCLSESPFSYEPLLKKYEATSRLLAEVTPEDDPHYIEELEVFSEDLRRQIITAVSGMYSPSSEKSHFYNCDGELRVTRQAELVRAISKICGECYYLTPVLNNEMVNKQRLNQQNIKARGLVIDWLLKYSEAPMIPCMDGSGPEVSIFKSAFVHTGLDARPRVSDKGMNAVLDLISGFIESCEERRRKFSELYDLLSSPPYGMRKGIIPLLIAYEARQYKGSMIIYFKDHEIELSPSTLNSLNDAPDDYQLFIESGTAEKKRYLDRLCELFNVDTDSAAGMNRVYPIVKNMQSWLRCLPEYTKKHRFFYKNGERKPTDSATDFIRNELMKFEINSRELLFEKFIPSLSRSNDPDEAFDVILRVRAELDAHLADFRRELMKKLIAIFAPDYQGGLSSAVILWYKKLPETTKKHIFDGDANSLLSLAANIPAYDETTLTDDLVSIFASMAIEDFNDQTAENFISDISDAVSRINDFVGVEKKDDQCLLSISIGGVTTEKNFGAEAITTLGKTALNNLRAVFDEYNDALEPDEKLAILTKLISEIID